MSPDKLNEEIALLRGWKPPGHPETEAVRRTHKLTHSAYDHDWLSPGPSGKLQSSYPDYAGEWRDCGPLLEEMHHAAHEYWCGSEDDGCLRPQWGHCGDLCVPYSENRLTETIAAAWLAWTKEEKRGS